MSELTPAASTDGLPHLSLVVRVQARKAELEAALAGLEPADRSRRSVEDALNQVEGLLTGDLDHVPHVVAAELSKWLEASKHVGERPPADPS